MNEHTELSEENTLKLDGIPKGNLSWTDIEKHTLSQMLKNEMRRSFGVEMLCVDDFHISEHRQIFYTIATLHSEGEEVSWVKVKDRLRKDGYLHAAGGSTTILLLGSEPLSFFNIKEFCDLLLARSAIRNSLIRYEGILEGIDESVKQMIEEGKRQRQAEIVAWEEARERNRRNQRELRAKKKLHIRAAKAPSPTDDV